MAAARATRSERSMVIPCVSESPFRPSDCVPRRWIFKLQSVQHWVGRMRRPRRPPKWLAAAALQPLIWSLRILGIRGAEPATARSANGEPHEDAAGDNQGDQL